MSYRNKLWVSLGVLCLLGSSLVVSCGKKQEAQEASDSRSTLEEIARQAMGTTPQDISGSAVTEMIEAAGYKIKSTAEFPSHWAGVKGEMLIYADKKDKSGGVIYGAVQGTQMSAVWHWFFDNEVPASVEPVELNDDGLWDVRITMSGGKKLELVQDQAFSMMRPTREDWIAQNGACSPPFGDDAAMWLCFDSDSTTAWRSKIGGGQKPFIEVPAPFGIAEGVLTVRTTKSGQPRHGALYADGKRVQDLELEGKAATQMLKLAPEAKGAHKIKLEFDSVYGDADYVAVAELGVK